MDNEFDARQGSGYDGDISSTSSGFGSASGGAGTGTAARMKETAANKVNEAKETIADFGRKTVDQIDSQREPVANALNRTASALHTQGENAASVAHSAADRLDSTADYVRQHDLSAMMTDVQDLAKRYPGQVLAVAVGVGFLIGRLFRNST